VCVCTVLRCRLHSEDQWPDEDWTWESSLIEWARSAGCTSPVSLAYGYETNKRVHCCFDAMDLNEHELIDEQQLD
jgi:hypothetical protein